MSDEQKKNTIKIEIDLDDYIEDNIADYVSKLTVESVEKKIIEHLILKHKLMSFGEIKDVILKSAEQKISSLVTDVFEDILQNGVKEYDKATGKETVVTLGSMAVKAVEGFFDNRPKDAWSSSKESNGQVLIKNLIEKDSEQAAKKAVEKYRAEAATSVNKIISDTLSKVILGQTEIVRKAF